MSISVLAVGIYYLFRLVGLMWIVVFELDINVCFLTVLVEFIIGLLVTIAIGFVVWWLTETIVKLNIFLIVLGALRISFYAQLTVNSF